VGLGLGPCRRHGRVIPIKRRKLPIH
jgi:hypothetical protein